MLSKVVQILKFIFSSIASRHLWLLSPSGDPELRTHDTVCLKYTMYVSRPSFKLYSFLIKCFNNWFLTHCESCGICFGSQRQWFERLVRYLDIFHMFVWRPEVERGSSRSDLWQQRWPISDLKGCNLHRLERELCGSIRMVWDGFLQTTSYLKWSIGWSFWYQA
jgi:hypothetical protein